MNENLFGNFERAEEQYRTNEGKVEVNEGFHEAFLNLFDDVAEKKESIKELKEEIDALEMFSFLFEDDYEIRETSDYREENSDVESDENEEDGDEKYYNKMNENPESDSDIKKTEDDTEKKDLTSEEINELQKKVKDEFFEQRREEGDKLSDAEKGNLGEILMDLHFIGQGYTPIHQPRVTDLEHKSGQGIDGVYEKINADGTKSYIIADAKVNHAKLNKNLADGTDQMSDAWVNKRIDNAVGKDKADEMREAYENNPDSVSKKVYHFSYDENDPKISSADVTTVDEDGNLNKDKEKVQIFDEYGNEIVGGESDD